MIVDIPSNAQYMKPRSKKIIKIRPLPQSGITEFGKVIISHNWNEVLDVTDINVKVTNFHQILRKNLDKFFPEKLVIIISRNSLLSC